MARRLALLALSTLVSCVSTTPPLEQDAAPEEEVGYVAARLLFTGPRGWGGRFAFELKPWEGESLHFGFGSPKQQGEWEVRLIPVPPGVYRVESWVAYDSYGKVANREPFGFGSFLVRPGHVVFLGTFRAQTDRAHVPATGGKGTAIRLSWSFQADKTRADEASASLRSAYARFATAPVECVLCGAPEPGATSPATRALTPEEAEAQGIPIPEPAAARKRSRSKEAEEKVPEDRNGLW